MNKGLLLNLIYIFCNTLLIAQTETPLNLNMKDSSFNIMNYFGLIEVSMIKISKTYIPKDSTGSAPWIIRSDYAESFDSIQKLLYQIPANGDIWKDFDCNETTTLEVSDGYFNKRSIYFNCGALSSPGNSAYYSSYSFLNSAETSMNLFKFIQDLDKQTHE